MNAKQATFHQLDTMLDGYEFTGHGLKIFAETSVPYNEDQTDSTTPQRISATCASTGAKPGGKSSA